MGPISSTSSTTEDDESPDAVEVAERIADSDVPGYSLGRKIALVLLAICTGIAVFTIVLPSSNDHADPTSAKTTRVAQQNSVTEYVQALKAWNSCITEQQSKPATNQASANPCGATPPQRPHTRSLDAYFADVSRWTSCASPFLNRRAVPQAVNACGLPPDPSQPPYSLAGVTASDLGMPDPVQYRSAADAAPR